MHLEVLSRIVREHVRGLFWIVLDTRLGMAADDRLLVIDHSARA